MRIAIAVTIFALICAPCVADTVWFGKRTVGSSADLLEALDKKAWADAQGLTDEQIEQLVEEGTRNWYLFQLYESITPATDADGDTDIDLQDVKLLISQDDEKAYALDLVIADAVCTTLYDETASCAKAADQLAGMVGSTATAASIGAGGHCRISIAGEKFWGVTRCQ